MAAETRANDAQVTDYTNCTLYLPCSLLSDVAGSILGVGGGKTLSLSKPPILTGQSGLPVWRSCTHGAGRGVRWAESSSLSLSLSLSLLSLARSPPLALSHFSLSHTLSLSLSLTICIFARGGSVPIRSLHPPPPAAVPAEWAKGCNGRRACQTSHGSAHSSFLKQISHA